MRRTALKLAALALNIPGWTVMAHETSAEQAGEASSLLFAEIAINNIPAGTFMIAHFDGKYYLQPATLAKLNIPFPRNSARLIEDEIFIPLHAIGGIETRFEEDSQKLGLELAPEKFTRQILSARHATVQPTDAAFGLFINYDLNIQHSYDRWGGGGFFEFGASDDWGLAISSFSVRKEIGDFRGVRLDSYFLRDNPDALTRMVIGDTFNSAPAGVGQFRFGGIRWGTEFALQPDFISFPTPALDGEVLLPSRVELFVNNVLRYRNIVGSGPFSIDTPPIITGSGEITLVTRDLLGVEHKTTSSYYASPQLLRRGLSAWSLEAGAARQNYGIENFDYGPAFAAGTFRHGISGRLTIEGRAELSEELQAGMVTSRFLLGNIGEFDFNAALANSGGDTGLLYGAGFRHISPRWNLAASYRHRRDAFRTLADQEFSRRPEEELNIAAGASLSRWGSINISYSSLDYPDGDENSVVTANYNLPVGQRGYVSAFAINSDSANSGTETIFGLRFSLSLGGRSNAHAQADNHGFHAELRKTPDYQGGFGYRLATTTGRTERQQAEISWRGDAGEAELAIARQFGDTAIRGRASGSLLFSDGGVTAARRIDNGSAIVDTGMADIPVYQDNRLVGHSSPEGMLVIPNLRPYEDNRISLDPADLPLGSKVAADILHIVPRFRGVARAGFRIEKQFPVTVLLIDEGGRPVPTGTAISFPNGGESFVGHGGEIFVEQAITGLVITAGDGDNICTARLPDMDNVDVMAMIGPLPCRKEKWPT